MAVAHKSAISVRAYFTYRWGFIKQRGILAYHLTNFAKIAKRESNIKNTVQVATKKSDQMTL